MNVSFRLRFQNTPFHSVVGSGRICYMFVTWQRSCRPVGAVQLPRLQQGEVVPVPDKLLVELIGAVGLYLRVTLVCRCQMSQPVLIFGQRRGDYPCLLLFMFLVHWLVGARLDCCLSRTGKWWCHDTEIIVIIYSPGSPD